jgi:hypothetical protein
MGSAASRVHKEDHHSLVHVASSHRFTLSSHLFAGPPGSATAGFGDLETSEGKMIRIAGGGNKRTVVQLDLPQSAPDYRQVGEVKNWWQILHGQRAQDRTIEVRITITLVNPASAPNLDSTAHHWPRCVYFDAELNGATLAPNANSFQHDLVQTIRFEKELVGLHRSAQATLVIKPEFTSFFMHSSFRIAFRGDSTGGDSYIRIRASPWERMTLPAGFDPRQDPGHQCMMNGERLCQPVNQLSELGIGGRHFEYVPIDVDDTRALSLAVRWHQVLESARHAPSRLSSPTGDATIQPTSTRAAPAPSPYHTPHLYERHWAAETLESPDPVFVAGAEPASARGDPTDVPSSRWQDEDRVIISHVKSPLRSPQLQQAPPSVRQDVTLNISSPAKAQPEEKEPDADPFSYHSSPRLRSPLASTPATAGRDGSAVKSPGSMRGGRLPPMSSKGKNSLQVPGEGGQTSGGDRSPQRSPVQPNSSNFPADLHITVASSPTAAAPSSNRQASMPSPQRPLPSDVPIYASPNASGRPAQSPTRVPPGADFTATAATAAYDPFSPHYAPQVEHVPSTRHAQSYGPQPTYPLASPYGPPQIPAYHQPAYTTAGRQQGFFAADFDASQQQSAQYPQPPQSAMAAYAQGRPPQTFQVNGFVRSPHAAPPPPPTTRYD